MAGGRPIGPIFAYLPARGDACFASISQVINGTRWNCNVFPRGKEPGVPTFHFYASTEAKAKAWIERWARHHWRSVELPPWYHGSGS
jgi:hypothetical protein